MLVDRVPIAVFASGSGSNLQVILDAERHDDDWPARVVLVVSDRPESMAVKRAQRRQVPVFARSPRDYSDKTAFELDVLNALREAGVAYIALAGYMRIIGPVLLEAYQNKVLNVHPSLLPAFPGRHAVKDALAAGVTETGVTVHLVDQGIDTGPVLAQRVVPVDAGMAENQLLARVHAVEHQLYPYVIRRFLTGQPME